MVDSIHVYVDYLRLFACFAFVRVSEAAARTSLLITLNLARHCVLLVMPGETSDEASMLHEAFCK